MNIDKVRELAEVFRENGLTRLEVSQQDMRIVLEREARSTEPAATAAPIRTESVAADEISSDEPVNFNDLTEVRSPIVGVFYSSPSPDSPPFVSIGDKVRRGDTLCIIEAMKLLNEITAEQDGEIADICIRNGDIAEYGQVLFKLI